MKKALYNPEEAALYLGFTSDSLKASRTTGILAGVPSPTYTKIGTKSVRYRPEDLDAWVEQYAKVVEKAGN